jgi:hypothetical protein
MTAGSQFFSSKTQLCQQVFLREMRRAVAWLRNPKLSKKATTDCADEIGSDPTHCGLVVASHSSSIFRVFRAFRSSTSFDLLIF